MIPVLPCPSDPRIRFFSRGLKSVRNSRKVSHSLLRCLRSVPVSDRAFDLKSSSGNHNLKKLLWLIAFLITMLHVAVRDRWDWTAPLFYMLPMPIVLFTLLCISVCFGIHHHHRHLITMCMLIVLLVFFWVHQSWCFNRPGHDRTNTRVLLWNAGRIGDCFPLALEALIEFSPDIVGLVKSNGISRIPSRTRIGPDGRYQVVSFGQGMTVITRGDVIGGIREKTGHGSWFSDCRIRFSHRDVWIRLVDISSNPFRSRWSMFERMSRDPDGSIPDVILGDFNTPSGACSFEPIRKNFHNAFESAGMGFHATWPLPVRMMAIDHIWVRNGIPIRGTEIVPFRFSDHALVLTDLSFPAR